MKIKVDIRGIRAFNYKLPIYDKWIKRILDVIISIIGLILSLPIIIILVPILYFTQGSPILFSQIRIGLNGKKFKMYKFRTMKKNAENLIENFTEKERKEYEENFKLKNDARVTKIGKALRETCIDEIPQFINILKGDMTLIGPRPIVEKEIEKYNNVDKQKLLKKKPGLLGYWQVYANENTTYERRKEMELYYVDNASFFFDIKIFFKSIATITRKLFAN